MSTAGDIIEALFSAKNRPPGDAPVVEPRRGMDGDGADGDASAAARRESGRRRDEDGDRPDRIDDGKEEHEIGEESFHVASVRIGVVMAWRSRLAAWYRGGGMTSSSTRFSTFSSLDTSTIVK